MSEAARHLVLATIIGRRIREGWPLLTDNAGGVAGLRRPHAGLSVHRGSAGSWSLWDCATGSRVRKVHQGRGCFRPV